MYQLSWICQLVGAILLLGFSDPILNTIGAGFVVLQLILARKALTNLPSPNNEFNIENDEAEVDNLMKRIRLGPYTGSYHVLQEIGVTLFIVSTHYMIS